MKDTRTIATKVQAIVSAQFARQPLDAEVAAWVGSISDKLHRKLVAIGVVPPRVKSDRATLAGFVDGFISDRSDVKAATATVYTHTRRCLVAFFGADRLLDTITPGDADTWRRNLGRPKPTSVGDARGEGLSENTVKRRCGIAKQFFRAAVRHRLIEANPFADMKGTTVRGNRARDFFVSREDAQRVLDACPDAEWRLLFALSRFGGLRCPSEHLALRRGDVDWARGRLTVHSPKTPHHDGRDQRVIPLFPELRSQLDAVYHQAPPGTEFVIMRYRDAGQNLRTQLERIIRRAGLKPWPKLFQNLRSTRQTELAEHFPAHAVCQWIGNSQAVAREHYLQVTDEHFEKAGKMAQTGQPDEDRTSQAPTPIEVTSEDVSETRGSVLVAMGDEGLEPPTSAV